MKEAVAVEVELEQRRHRVVGADGELAVAVGAAGHVDAVAQQVEGVHDHVLGVAGKAKVKVPREDLLLHVEEVLHQLGQRHPLERSGRDTGTS